MGLDLALGVIVIAAAVRGWLKGFVSQAVRIGSFIVCFYLADPVREQARPYVTPKLPSIDTALMDRILWWAAAVLSYIVLVALGTLSLKLMQTPPPPGTPKSRREDRYGGLILGAAKGLLIAAILGAAVQKYGTDLARLVPWGDRQTQGSYALKWTAQYQPVPRLWATPPIRRFVEHIQNNGLAPALESEVEKQVAERTSMEAEARDSPPPLELTPEAGVVPEIAPQALDLDPDLDRELKGYKSDLQNRRDHR
jgi:hypothetical protein